jgi:hypothetical protein
MNMRGHKLREAMPRPANFTPATLRVGDLATPPRHAVPGTRYWHVAYSDGRRRIMAERTLTNTRLFTLESTR